MRKSLLAALALVAALAALSGCSRSKPVAADEVALMVHASARELPVWQKAVDAFTEATKIKVVILNVPAERYYDRLQSMAGKSRPPDVVLMSSTRFPEFVTRDVLESLDQYFKAGSDLKPSDFFPTAVRAYRYQGGTYGLPSDINVLCMAFNSDYLELQMTRAPGKDWTWQDYTKLAKTLTTDADDDGKTDHWGTTVCPWWQVPVWQNGGEVVDDPGNPQRSTLSTPQCQEALQFLADLHLKERVAPPPSQTEGAGRISLFGSGRVGMACVSAADMPSLNQARDLRWAPHVLPRGKVAANLGTANGFCMTKGSSHKEEAWRLMAFLAGLDGQKLLLGGGFTTPAHEALSDSEYFQVPGLANTKPLLEGLQVARPLPCTPRYKEIAKVWDEEFKALWSGQASVTEVTARIDERVNKILAESKPTTAWLLPLTPAGG